MSASILIVEDEYAVARGIEYALKQEGYEVTVARNGEEGLELATRHAPDLVILDVRLPGMDGFEMLRRVRGAGNKAPVLFLTARDEEMDKVIGLELGADDYLTKPFGLRELMSRIKALLRRAYGDLADAAGGRVIRHRDLLIDLERRRVQRGTRRISLTATEFEILRHLASKPGRVFTRRELLELVRDYEALDQDEKTINVHVQPPAREARGRPVRPGLHPDHPRSRLRLRRTLGPPSINHAPSDRPFRARPAGPARHRLRGRRGDRSGPRRCDAAAAAGRLLRTTIDRRSQAPCWAGSRIHPARAPRISSSREAKRPIRSLFRHSH